MEPKRIADDVSHPLAGVERRVGVLEDHLHLPPKRLELSPPQPDDLAPVEAHRARGRLEKLEDGAAQGGLPAAGFADQAERLALGDVEADPVHGAHAADLVVEDDPDLDREVLDEVAHLDAALRSARAVPGVTVVSAAASFTRRAPPGRCGRLDDAKGPLLLRREPAAVGVPGLAPAYLERAAPRCSDRRRGGSGGGSGSPAAAPAATEAGRRSGRACGRAGRSGLASDPRRPQV